jgi:hypothetical protein
MSMGIAVGSSTSGASTPLYLSAVVVCRFYFNFLIFFFLANHRIISY